MSFGLKLGALAWARDNAHACHLFRGGGAIFISSPPPVEIAVTPRLLGRGRLPLEFFWGAFRGETAANVGGGWLVVLRSRKSTRVPSLAGLACDHEVAPPRKIVIPPPATSRPLPALSTYFTSKAPSARESRPWLPPPPEGARGASRGANFMKFERCGPELWSGRGPRGGKRAF